MGDFTEPKKLARVGLSRFVVIAQFSILNHGPGVAASHLSRISDKRVLVMLFTFSGLRGNGRQFLYVVDTTIHHVHLRHTESRKVAHDFATFF
jgi:hypothetical protein